MTNNRFERYDPVMVPEVPDGPLATGEPYWYWLGGRPALDLVNTRRERWRRKVECLTSDREVVAWLVAADLLPEPQPAPRNLVREARELREAIDAGVRAAVAGERIDAPALRLIDDWLVLASARPTLALGPDGQPALGERPLADSPRRALGLVALDAAHMLGTPDQRSRVRICSSETCSARFYDRSQAGRRRWCSMQACGNVEKARRHRAKVAA
jgi:predicted RNA-binding Zn ribbon-like protein